MNSEFLQDLVYEIYDAIDRHVGIVDDSNFLVAFSNLKEIDYFREHILNNFFKKELEFFLFENYYCKNFKTDTNLTYTILVEGTTEETLKYLKIIDIFISDMKIKIDLAYEKEFFIKRILLDNIYINDISIKAKNFNIKTDEERCVLLIKFLEPKKEIDFKAIETALSATDKDFAMQTEKNKVVLIKNVDEIKKNKNKYIIDFANQIVFKMANEFSTKVCVGIGSKVLTLKDISVSFKEAKIALKIGRIFNNNKKSVICYNNLGLTRLIYNMPRQICEDFLNEILTKEKIKTLDKETIFTINKFFENNLNISEASRKLFIHRNTLVYRLEKIKNMTGIDLRIFEQAIVFKLAILIKKYLDYIEFEK